MPRRFETSTPAQAISTAVEKTGSQDTDHSVATTRSDVSTLGMGNGVKRLAPREARQRHHRRGEPRDPPPGHRLAQEKEAEERRDHEPHLRDRRDDARFSDLEA